MIFTTLACLCVLSFLVGVLTDPGRVPSSYIPDVEDTSFASDQEPKKNVFYNGLDANARSGLDRAIGGALTNRTYEE
ncbi:hypothetical protein Goklo_025089, partial [Gossypium klotzschianum]|nr:hypothetical protein [Gossypium klotzschianum]